MMIGPTSVADRNSPFGPDSVSWSATMYWPLQALTETLSGNSLRRLSIASRMSVLAPPLM